MERNPVRTILLFAGTLFSYLLNAQHLRSVNDAVTGDAIPFATIKVLHTNNGIIANEKGEFVLNIMPSDTIMVSSIGYQTIKLAGNNIGNTINLDPNTTVLKEVKVHNKYLQKTIVLGNGASWIDKPFKYRLTREGPKDDCYPWLPSNNSEEFAEQIDLPEDSFTYRIKRIYLPVRSNSCWDTIVLRIYGKSIPDNKPGEEIYRELILPSKRSVIKNKMVIELTEASLQFNTGETFYISMGWLNNWSRNKQCITQIPLFNTKKDNSYTRHLASPSYDWYRYGRMVKGINIGTMYAVELEIYK